MVISLNIAVVCSSKNKLTLQLADELARYGKTHVIEINEYDFNQKTDLLILGFSSLPQEKKIIKSFISKLSRAHVSNFALFSTYHMNDRRMQDIISYAIKKDLPLMREQCYCKLPLFSKKLPDDIKQLSRCYIDDMITICEHYY